MVIKYPNIHKMFRMAIKHIHFTILGPAKFTRIGIFGFKINHLAALPDSKTRRNICSEIVATRVKSVFKQKEKKI
jgi:hypothetical protein